MTKTCGNCGHWDNTHPNFSLNMDTLGWCDDHKGATNIKFRCDPFHWTAQPVKPTLESVYDSVLVLIKQAHIDRVKPPFVISFGTEIYVSFMKACESMLTEKIDSFEKVRDFRFMGHKIKVDHLTKPYDINIISWEDPVKDKQCADWLQKLRDKFLNKPEFRARIYGEFNQSTPHVHLADGSVCLAVRVFQRTPDITTVLINDGKEGAEIITVYKSRLNPNCFHEDMRKVEADVCKAGNQDIYWSKKDNIWGWRLDRRSQKPEDISETPDHCKECEHFDDMQWCKPLIEYMNRHPVKPIKFNKITSIGMHARYPSGKPANFSPDTRKKQRRVKPSIMSTRPLFMARHPRRMPGTPCNVEGWEKIDENNRNIYDELCNEIDEISKEKNRNRRTATEDRRGW